ncbi:ribonuclease G [Coralloluteibacterium stylophorae]|uniref:Ribonuclease G n=1 Tax=Coralloluteibacterium stylophorae TaxID=1776034 RepID=A0A8J7VTI7_9GAMM|nr:ribonuclease G [Coralloluteibacterium stylophorae]MBS7456243.1 ribonuclease G [Coralloluteibacterium stylophorae]
MSEEILINVTPRETRVAVVENGMPQEVHIERASRRGYVGNIYRGRVQRVMPGMQAAFIEIGLERAAFLHASDILRPPPALSEDGEPPAPAPPPPIAELVREGQEITVQVAKDPIGSKGARLTTQLSIPSRYLVLLPYSRVIGVSARIEDETERQRLKTVMGELMAPTGMGCIVRTNAEGQAAAALGEDVDYLLRAWEAIGVDGGNSRAGQRIYEDLPLPLRTVRDLLRSEIDKVRVDSLETFERMRAFARQFTPELADRLEHYSGDTPIFDLYGVEDEIQRAMRKEVPLKSGGHLVIDQTEAMTTVDVNTGSFLGQRNLEETVYRTNLEAAQAVARQLRLRNLGGIVIIDFIDMIDADHRRQVLRTLEKALTRDHARTNVHDFSPLGLIEMTRKRTTESLERQLCEPCPACAGRGQQKTAETVTYEIFREITRAVRQFDASQLMVLASPKVVARVLEEESAAVAELEEFLGKTIRFQADDQYAQEQYDVVLL